MEHTGKIVEVATPARRGVTCDHLDLIQIGSTYLLFRKGEFQEGDVQSPFPAPGVPKPTRRFAVHENLDLTTGVTSSWNITKIIERAGKTYNLPVLYWGDVTGYSATKRQVLWHPENWEPKES